MWVCQFLKCLFPMALFLSLKDMLEEGSFQLPKGTLRPFQMSPAIINPYFLTGPVANFLASFIISNAYGYFRILQKVLDYLFKGRTPSKDVFPVVQNGFSLYLLSISSLSVCLSYSQMCISFTLLKCLHFILVLCLPLTLATLSSLDPQKVWGSAH